MGSLPWPILSSSLSRKEAGEHLEGTGKKNNLPEMCLKALSDQASRFIIGREASASREPVPPFALALRAEFNSYWAVCCGRRASGALGCRGVSSGKTHPGYRGQSLPPGLTRHWGVGGPSVEACKQKVQGSRGAGGHPLLKLP